MNGLGSIPVDWEVAQIGSVGTVVTGSTPLTADRSNYGQDHLFVSPADLGRTKYVTSTGKMLSHRGFALTRQIPVGSTLFVCIGSTIGKVGVAGVDLATNQQINSIVPGQRVAPEFLYYAASTLSALVREQAGEQAVPLINKSQFSEFEIALPPRREQQAIATALADADELVDDLKRFISKKRAIKQGMMQQLLTGRTRLPGFAGVWTPVQLADVAAVDPEAISPAIVPANDVIDYISLEDVSKGSVFGSTKYRFGDAPSRARRGLRSGDVLFGTVRPNLQSHGRYGGGLSRPVASTGFAVIRNKPGVTDSRYLAQWVLSGDVGNQIERIIAGSNYPAVSSGDVRRLELQVPPTDEQEAIGRVLQDADDEIEALDRRLEATRAIKQGMMQELLTGRTRIVGEGAA